MESAELVIKHGDVTSIHNDQITDNADSFNVLRITCQYILNEVFNDKKKPLLGRKFTNKSPASLFRLRIQSDNIDNEVFEKNV